MIEYMPGGRRRIDRVLAPEFSQGWDELDVAELSARRSDADQEETDLSYARRLLQGRLDILRAEQAARAAGQTRPTTPRTDAEIAAHLSTVLADGPRQDRGMGRHLATEPTRVGEHRREAERAVADVSMSDPAAMSDADLVAAVDKLADIERRVSASRKQVQQVVDALADHIAQRMVIADLTETHKLDLDAAETDEAARR